VYIYICVEWRWEGRGRGRKKNFSQSAKKCLALADNPVTAITACVFDNTFLGP
jgi:hypothetical protein